MSGWGAFVFRGGLVRWLVEPAVDGAIPSIYKGGIGGQSNRRGFYVAINRGGSSRQEQQVRGVLFFEIGFFFTAFLTSKLLIGAVGAWGCGRKTSEWAMPVARPALRCTLHSNDSLQKSGRYMLPHPHRDHACMKPCIPCGEKTRIPHQNRRQKRLQPPKAAAL